MNRDRPNEPPLPEALAYFLTWVTYGTWLPGDERGWVDHGWGQQEPDPIRKREAELRMAEGACSLDPEQRTLVEQTIADHCRIRGWALHAVNCRSNHVHVVLTAAVSPAEAREQLKAWSTRRLKERDRQRLQAARKKWWSERGSGRFINDEAGLENVIHYVRDLQD
jgi:REP element-mobilizing transposase RayT